jgi:hypothetical protein
MWHGDHVTTFHEWFCDGAPVNQAVVKMYKKGLMGR